MIKIIKIMKRIIMAILVIYAFNFVLKYANIFIPINIPSISSVSLLGIPGYIGLVVIYLFIK